MSKAAAATTLRQPRPGPPAPLAVLEPRPATTQVSLYLYVDDADALYAEWTGAGAGGRLHAPEDTDYGLREGAHVDSDGNLIRFGSGLGAPRRSSGTDS